MELMPCDVIFIMDPFVFSLNRKLPDRTIFSTNDPNDEIQLMILDQTQPK
jgi:hypothetical protein